MKVSRHLRGDISTGAQREAGDRGFPERMGGVPFHLKTDMSHCKYAANHRDAPEIEQGWLCSYLSIYGIHRIASSVPKAFSKPN